MTVVERLRSWAKRVKRDGLTLWFASRHPRTPWFAKALAVFVVAYAFSPIDLIPDFIPVIGYLDDLLLLPGLIWLALRLTPEEVLVECRAQADERTRNAVVNSKSLAGLLGVLVIWTAGGAALWYWVVRPWLGP